MDLSAAAALCLWLLSACRPRDGLEAAAVLRAAGAGPAQSPGGARTLAPAAGDTAIPALAAAAVPGVRAARRAAGMGFRNGSIVPHQFMLSLYRSLAGKGAPTSGPGHHGRADTITGFADQATPEESAAETGQSFVFDVSSLPDVDEVVAAELRVLRRAPNPGSASSAWSLQLLLLLSTCPGAPRTPRLLHSRAADSHPQPGERWEVFDVADALRGHRREPRTGRAFCLRLRAVAGPARDPLSLRGLGFGSLGSGSNGEVSEERALLVVSSRTHRKDSLFREIRTQARRALGAALGADPSPESDPGFRVPPTMALSGRRRRRTAVNGVRGAPSSGSAGRGHGRRGRSRCSRKPLHVDFKELGWDDWIIAPLDYEAYHCEGVCDFPLRSHLEPTNHAIIQTLLNSMAPDAAPASCCVPARLSPISILYIDAANNVVYKQYEDMVVEACGCR
ncbi:growth/differentiation factor 7 [Suncus etruscus]|uniref:growth/differentiation factor 7 n=1 Tax=Suncus etruscus TaxID=109475 RepID=UPI002110A5BC|nr:growth/differentiation factor 7 [Suncus etruscus]